MYSHRNLSFSRCSCRDIMNSEFIPTLLSPLYGNFFDTIAGRIIGIEFQLQMIYVHEYTAKYSLNCSVARFELLIRICAYFISL